MEKQPSHTHATPHDQRDPLCSCSECAPYGWEYSPYDGPPQPAEGFDPLGFFLIQVFLLILIVVVVIAAVTLNGGPQ